MHPFIRIIQKRRRLLERAREAGALTAADYETRSNALAALEARAGDERALEQLERVKAASLERQRVAAENERIALELERAELEAAALADAAELARLEPAIEVRSEDAGAAELEPFEPLEDAELEDAEDGAELPREDVAGAAGADTPPGNVPGGKTEPTP